MMSRQAAVQHAIALAAEGPRVAAVVEGRENEGYRALPGYMDKDLEQVRQINLVTPDGRVWFPVEESQGDENENEDVNCCKKFENAVESGTMLVENEKVFIRGKPEFVDDGDDRTDDMTDQIEIKFCPFCNAMK